MRDVGFWLRWSRRDLRQRWVLVLTLALVVALATGVGAGLGSMETWRIRSNDASFELLRMHDLRVSLTSTGSVDAGALAAAAKAVPHPELIAAHGWSPSARRSVRSGGDRYRPEPVHCYKKPNG